MTIFDQSTNTALRPVAVDLYRDIHKGIRAELFAVTEAAGALDPSLVSERADLAANVRQVVDLLVSHAEHEDAHIQPVLELHLPALAQRVEDDHQRLEAGLLDLSAWADEAAADSEGSRWHAHRVYLELAAFASSYLAHQDLEERVIMPTLEAIIGPDAGLDLHVAIVGSIPPEEMATALAAMLPAMNIDDRTELLGGMQHSAPPEVFDGVWGLAGSVLDPRDHAGVAARLGL